MRHRRILALVIIGTTTNATGCASTFDLTPTMVARLDGFKAGQSVPLALYDGQAVMFSEKTALIWQSKGAPEARATFQSIEIEGQQFTGVDRARLRPITFDLTRIEYLKVEQPSKTTGADKAAAGIFIGLLVIGGGALLIANTTGSIGYARPLRVPGCSSPVRAALMTARRKRIPASRPRFANDATRARILAHWSREASAESASIPAFMALARDLKRASAPAGLVRAALHAAREEATHAELCTHLANEHASAPIAPSMPATPHNDDRNYASLLERLALEAFWDGCVAEGSASAIADISSLHAKDELTRLALQTIARDEKRHAELAGQTIAFCLSAGGHSVRNALRESFERKRADEETRLEAHDQLQADESADDEELLRRFGVPGKALLQRARIETWEKSCAFIEQLSS